MKNNCDGKKCDAEKTNAELRSIQDKVELVRRTRGRNYTASLQLEGFDLQQKLDKHRKLIDELDELEDLERAFKKDFQALVDNYGAIVQIGRYDNAYAVEIPPVYEGREKVRDGCYFDLDIYYEPSN